MVLSVGAFKAALRRASAIKGRRLRLVLGLQAPARLRLVGVTLAVATSFISIVSQKSQEKGGGILCCRSLIMMQAIMTRNNCCRISQPQHPELQMLLIDRQLVSSTTPQQASNHTGLRLSYFEPFLAFLPFPPFPEPVSCPHGSC